MVNDTLFEGTKCQQELLTMRFSKKLRRHDTHRGEHDMHKNSSEKHKTLLVMYLETKTFKAYSQPLSIISLSSYANCTHLVFDLPLTHSCTT